MSNVKKDEQTVGMKNGASTLSGMDIEGTKIHFSPLFRKNSRVTYCYIIG